ncbi:hypothetical protein D9M68_432040 [compost metagenome]
MGIVPGGAEQAVEDLLEVAAQLFLALGIAIAQHLFGEAAELQRVVVGEGHAHAQRLTKAAAAQGGHGGGQGMQRGTAVDAHGLALVAQLAGVAGGAADVEVVDAGFLVLVARHAHRQVAGVLRCGDLFRIYQETEARQVFRAGEAVAGEGQFQGGEPLVAQALNRGALRRVVVGLARLVAPLVQIVQPAGRLVDREVGVGDVIEDDRKACEQQEKHQQKDTAKQAHQILPCSLLKIS